MRLIPTPSGGLALELSPRELAINAVTGDVSATPLRLTDGRVLLVAFLRGSGRPVGYYDAQTGRSVAGLYSAAQLAEFLAAARGASPVSLELPAGLVVCGRCGAVHARAAASVTAAGAIWACAGECAQA